MVKNQNSFFFLYYSWSPWHELLKLRFQVNKMRMYFFPAGILWCKMGEKSPQCLFLGVAILKSNNFWAAFQSQTFTADAAKIQWICWFFQFLLCVHRIDMVLDWGTWTGKKKSKSVDARKLLLKSGCLFKRILADAQLPFKIGLSLARFLRFRIGHQQTQWTDKNITFFRTFCMKSRDDIEKGWS